MRLFFFPSFSSGPVKAGGEEPYFLALFFPPLLSALSGT